jgi:hypothetical protein
MTSSLATNDNGIALKAFPTIRKEGGNGQTDKHIINVNGILQTPIYFV